MRRIDARYKMQKIGDVESSESCIQNPVAIHGGKAEGNP
jgi:hypothetical protein